MVSKKNVERDLATGGDEEVNNRRTRLSKADRARKDFRLLMVASAIIASFTIGSAVRQFWGLNEAGIGIAFGMPAIIALFGMFWVVDNWKDALTAAFAVTYIIFLAGIFAIFVFPQKAFELEGGAKAVFDGFSALMMVVMSAYFGQEAVRAAAQAYSDGKIFGGGGDTADDEEPAAPVQVDPNARSR